MPAELARQLEDPNRLQDPNRLDVCLMGPTYHLIDALEIASPALRLALLPLGMPAVLQHVANSAHDRLREDVPAVRSGRSGCR